MTSAQIRQSFLDFFQSKQHTIVPSSSLMPTAPNLLFTNAGMNQFVPYFLGDQSAPWKRVADTQKCIRAGGKHNDLEDVGFDTYHHTMFEMLGNWSFGDYFKKDSLTWGWELLTKVWGIPPKRLFATVYSPDKSKGDPADFDQEAYDIWAKIFKDAGLDPKVHIVNGNKKDNFWMMGDTGPCGPCSEIHFNLLPSDNEAEGRKGVNSSSPRCIEIWNHVFIQFNANADGTFAPLAAKHVDTGMGFERVAGIHATSKGFKDFSAEPSNYNADVFKPTFDKLTALSGKTYTKTVPTKRDGLTEQEQTDIAFRVLADHARCVSCAIADGILPGNEGRNYVIRRILRRGIMYGQKNLGLKTGDFSALVTPVIESLGNVFPELKTQRVMVEKAIRAEEESFGRTLDQGLQQFERASRMSQTLRALIPVALTDITELSKHLTVCEQLSADINVTLVEEKLNQLDPLNTLLSQTEAIRLFGSAASDASRTIQNLKRSNDAKTLLEVLGLGQSGKIQKALKRLTELQISIHHLAERNSQITGNTAFLLYDTYGFPLDMTQVLAAERGLTVNVDGFEKEMEKQREMGRAARKTDVIVASTEGEAVAEATKFVGYELEFMPAPHLVPRPTPAKVVDVVRTEKETFIVFDQTPFYAEMGGQVGDGGHVRVDHSIQSFDFIIVDTVKDKSGRHLHKVDPSTPVLPTTPTHRLAGQPIPNRELPTPGLIGCPAVLAIDFHRRRAINRHHSAAHLIHWALRKILGTHVRQFGTHKTPDRMRFDFTHFEQLTPAQLKECEQLINEKVIDNSPVVMAEIDYDKKPADVLAFFGDKYGKRVRVVDIGGFSKELCGGTHVTTTGEIGVIKIIAEMAIAAGTRRIEAVAGQAAYDFIAHEEAALKAVNARLGAGSSDVAAKLESVLNHQKELEKKLKAFEAKASAGLAEELAAAAVTKDGLKWVSAVVTADNADALRSLGSQVLHKVGAGAVVQLGAILDGKVSLVAYCSPEAIKAGQAAGKLIGSLTAKLGGKGGGKPDYAQGGGGDASKLAEVLKL